MARTYAIECNVGDIINYYREKRYSKTSKQTKDPNSVEFDVELETPKSCTYNLLLTDGNVSEIDSAAFIYDEIDQENVLKISKRVMVSEATYLVHIKFVKVAGNYITEDIVVYMTDLDEYNNMCNSFPHDIYFW